MKENEYKEAVLSVVRGESSWCVLKQYVDISRRPDKWEIGSCPFSPILPSISDFTQGMKKHSGNANAAQEWASFLLAASGLVELNSIEGNSGGEEVLESLWNLAFR